MRVHFIAIGGKIMHGLAIALQQKGDQVSGSDDAIYNPSAGRLERHGLLPEAKGWFPERITADLDAVILGMHAQADNPEYQRAIELGIPVYSFPEFVRQRAENKTRVVIAGSHGKTTITAMVMHVLEALEKSFDYLVGGDVPGFPLSVRLSEDAPILVLEGDEYPASRIDPQAKFFHYDHHIAVISGIAWDHINIYPTFESYLKAFRQLAQKTPAGGALLWNKQDKTLKNLLKEINTEGFTLQSYGAPKGRVQDGQTQVKTDEGWMPLQIFGKHNLSNLCAAESVCLQLGIESSDFYQAMKTFRGAGQRLEVLHQHAGGIVLRDYAHAPSKWKATSEAVREQFPKQRLLAVLELHTYSSLDPEFFPQFRHTLASADEVVIFCHYENLRLKGRPLPTLAALREAFFHPDLHLATSREALAQWLGTRNWDNHSLLFMSSGNFDTFDFTHFIETLPHTA